MNLDLSPTVMAIVFLVLAGFILALSAWKRILPGIAFWGLLICANIWLAVRVLQ